MGEQGHAGPEPSDKGNGSQCDRAYEIREIHQCRGDREAAL